MSLISKIVQAAIVVAAIGGIAAAAAPAQAAPYYPPPMPYHMHHHNPPPMMCLTPWQLKGAIARAGYSAIRVFDGHGPFAWAKAVRGHWVYSLKVNACTGQIVSANRDHPIY